MWLQRATHACTRWLTRTPLRTVGAVAAGLLALGSAVPSAAEELAPEAAPAITIAAPLDKSAALHVEGQVAKVVVSQPETVEVSAVGGKDLYVIGRQPGRTNLLVYDDAGRLTQTVDVRVGADAQALRETLASALPDEELEVTELSTGLMVSGEVSGPAAARVAEALAEQAAPGEVVSRVHARAAQVRLDVRIVEASERRLQELSADLAAASADVGVAVGSGPVGLTPPHGTVKLDKHRGRWSLKGLFRALEDRGSLRLVAKPTLVALSGEQASFRAGGELPYPIPQDNGRVSIEFRPYGASLKAAPLVLEGGAIRLAVDAELSAVDPAKGMRLAGVNLPGLAVRRASTVVDLRDGQSFVVAGMLDEQERANGRGAPLLDRLPLVRAVARAIQSRTERRELAFVVTPHIVRGDEPPPRTSLDDLLDAAPIAEPRPQRLQTALRDVRRILAPPLRIAGRAGRFLLTPFRA